MHVPSIGSTHWGRGKIAAITQTTLSNALFLYENVSISLNTSLKFDPKLRINYILALFQGDKPLSDG